MITERLAPTQERHMEHIRFYPGLDPNKPSTVVGFSDGVVSIADDDNVVAYLTGKSHESRTLPDEETAMVVGSLSLRHIDITPPLGEDTIRELVSIMFASSVTGNLPQGVMAVDNRHGEIPKDRSLVSGPILGSLH